MTAPALISTLRERGATLRAEGDRLRVTPATVLTDCDRAEIRAHKAEILRALDTTQAPAEIAPATSTVEFDRTSGLASMDGRQSEVREFAACAAYDAARAANWAHRQFERGEITSAQRDTLLSFAHAAPLEVTP